MPSRADTSTAGEALRVVNAQGASATFSAFGARLVELRVPDRDGALDNVVLGFDDDAEYRAHVDLYFGATIGRVAGRISRGAFELGGRRFELARNEGDTALHGGSKRAFDRVEWSARRTDTEHGPGVVFEYASPDGEEGYPGNLRAQAEYALSDRNELWITFRAVTDAPTPVNMTNHAYWNLNGAGPQSVLDHELRIAAAQTVAMGEDLVPTGGLEPVAGTAADFRAARRVGERLPGNDEPWPGFDAAYVLDDHDADTDVVVSLHDPASGRVMDMLTTEPSIQMYTANRVPDITGRDGRSYRAGNAICLEPQRMPDAVNRPEFASIVIAPGEEYRHVSCHRFSVR
jgi:aldose 1-epimerase